MFALYAEVSFDRFGKELRFVCVGDIIMAQCWIISLTLWLEKVLDSAAGCYILFFEHVPDETSKVRIHRSEFSKRIRI